MKQRWTSNSNNSANQMFKCRYRGLPKVLILVFICLLFSVPGHPAFLERPVPVSDAATGKNTGDTLKKLGQLIEKNKGSNAPEAIRYARIAMACAQKSPSFADRVDAYKWMGKAYMQNQKDSSYYYYNRALHLADSCKMVTQKIHVFYNLATLSSSSSNFKSALALLDSSARLAERVGDPEGITNAYNEMGNISYRLHDYEHARKMYESALKIARKDTLYMQMGVAIANLARKPFESDVKKSIALQKEAVSYMSRISGTEEQMAIVFLNMGTQNTNPDSALYYYKAALNLGIQANLPKVLFGAYNNMAYSYLDKKDVGRAETCLKDQAIPRAQELKDYDWLSSLYDTYADVCVEKGDFKKALELQKLAMKTRDIDNRQKGADQVRLLAAQLDLKNKELIIQNEEKELLLQANRLQQTELWLAIALLLVVGSILTTLILQQRNRARFVREQINSARRILEM
ncbi:MAG TPA: tetratricopeptide repeat protein, partial [Bacteroidales bacterium]|nr:tetratricopeptide repeat protein [Bacteroidales bacterium]